jgi:hypothetical protein
VQRLVNIHQYLMKLHHGHREGAGNAPMWKRGTTDECKGEKDTVPVL